MSKFIYLPLLLALPVFLPAQTFTATGGAIPDDGTLSVFDLFVSGLPAPAMDTANFGIESVCLNMTHTWNADLSLSLRAPDGTVIALFSGIGGDTDNFENTCLSGNATTSIFQAPHPFTGTFRPTGDMGVLNNGQSPNGLWQLIILDTYAFADAGELLDWSVTFGPSPCKPFPFESSDLPIVAISTGGRPIPDEPKIDASIRVLDNGPGQRNFLKQSGAAYEGPVGLELHGNSSQGFPKKSLRFETRDTLGEDLDVSLLGLPETSDFVLSANFSDKTLLRNALAYELSRDIGQYAPRTRFCEVVVDNTYQGVYVLTEKIKRGKNRVDVARLTPADTSGTALTGGYILSIDWNTSPGWNSPFSQPNSPNIFTYFQHEYPEHDVLHPAQMQYIRQYIDSFEVALAGPGFQEPQTGWRRFADEKSFLDFLFINEISRNVDGYRLSTYFHKNRDDRGGKLAMGPVWDFDLAFHNADYCDNWLVEGWAYNINYVCPEAGVPFWWERLMQDSLFAQNLACRWQTLRDGPLHTDALFARIDSMAAVVQESQQRNFQYWPILGIYIWPNPGPLPDTYAGEVQKMKDWMTERLDWLDAAFGQYLSSPDAGFAVDPGATPLERQFIPDLSSGTYQYLWDFGDGSSSNLAAPLHAFSAPGVYTVRLTISGAFGCSATSEQTVQVSSTSAGTTQPSPLRLFPNPASGSATLLLPEDWPGGSVLQVQNALGETVLHNPVPAGQRLLQLDLGRLPAGVYQLALRNADRQTAYVKLTIL